MVCNFPGVGQNFDEALGIVGGPTLVHFTIASKGSVHQIVGGSDAVQFKSIGMQGHENISRNVFLGVGQKASIFRITSSK